MRDRTSIGLRKSIQAKIDSVVCLPKDENQRPKDGVEHMYWLKPLTFRLHLQQNRSAF